MIRKSEPSLAAGATYYCPVCDGECESKASHDEKDAVLRPAMSEAVAKIHEMSRNDLIRALIAERELV